MKRRKIWIDLDNSPHVPFFAPIVEELRREGNDVVLTSRDNAQVRELATLHGLDSIEVGRHFGKKKVAKILGTLGRSLRLAVLMAREKPDIAFSHGSRSQMISASLIGVPSVVAFDYEFTSSAGVVRPTWVMAPEAIAVTSANPRYSLRYPGIKEDVYLSRFRPTLSLRMQLGLSANDLIVTIRPPASEAHYHNPLSDQLLMDVIKYVMASNSARIILLPRTKSQGESLQQQWRALISQGRILIPEHAVDGLNLVWNSDLVISGGGTMNREAAALGVPVYSIFRGKIGAVDRHLVSAGRLELIETSEDIRSKVKLIPRIPIPTPATNPRPALIAIMKHISMILDVECPQTKTEGAPEGSNGR